MSPNVAEHQLDATTERGVVVGDQHPGHGRPGTSAVLFDFRGGSTCAHDQPVLRRGSRSVQLPPSSRGPLGSSTSSRRRCRPRSGRPRPLSVTGHRRTYAVERRRRDACSGWTPEVLGRRWSWLREAMRKSCPPPPRRAERGGLGGPVTVQGQRVRGQGRRTLSDRIYQADLVDRRRAEVVY